MSPRLPSGGRNGFLSDVLVELGFASRETVEQAVRAARSPGTTVARVLVDTNAISEEQLARATAERYGIDYIDLDGFDVDPAAANLIKPTAARRYQAVPVDFLGKGLLVAMADPADALGVNDIAVMTKLEVRPAVALRPALDALLEALPLAEGGHADAHRQPTEAAGPAEVEESEDEEDEAPAPAPPASSAVFWQDGSVGDSLPEPPEPPEPHADSGDASRLREELTALKAQLAGAEARLADAAQDDHRADDSETERLRAELADAEAERDEARTRAKDAEGLRERADSIEAERDETRERAREAETELRRIRSEEEVRSGELETVRGKLTDAETELVRVRAEVDTRGSELEAMRTRAESAETEAESALRRTDEAEREVADARREAEEARREVEEARSEAEEARREVEEARREAADARREAAVARREVEEARREVEEARREAAEAQREAAETQREAAEARREAAEARREIEEAAGAREEARQLTEELEAADSRSEQARHALAELREESEREREQWAVAERDLRATLAEEESRRGELEERLSEVEGSAFAAERAFEELRLAQGRMRGALRALADPGSSESSDDD